MFEHFCALFVTFFIAVAAEQVGQRRRMAVSGRAEFRITLTPPPAPAANLKISHIRLRVEQAVDDIYVKSFDDGLAQTV